MYIDFLKRVPIGKRKGVITTTTILADSPVCEIKGNLVYFDKLNELEKPENALQIGPDTYLSPSGEVTDYIWHSCNPNCIAYTLGKRCILYSLHLITPGTEITFDYSTTSSEDTSTWLMKCKCGSFNCRKEISGFPTLDPNLQEKYKKHKMAALFLRENIFQRKF